MRWSPLMVLAASGCNEFGLDPVEPEPGPVRVVIEESFVQTALPAVDLLFVIDDTASMAQEHAALGESALDLVDGLDAAGIRWQIGVVTTDREASDAGVLRGRPWVLTPDMSDVAAIFAEMVDVGVDGAVPEAGFAAAVRALELATPDGPNASFRRPDAALHVIFVSDSDDQSEDWLGPEPALAFLDALAAEAAGGMPVRASAIVGDVPSGCTSDTSVARPGVRYRQVAEASGGIGVSICAADFGPLLADLGEASIVYGTRFALSGTPSADTVAVSVDGARLDLGWTLELGEVAEIVFDAAPAPGAAIVVSYVVQVDP